MKNKVWNPGWESRSERELMSGTQWLLIFFQLIAILLVFLFQIQSVNRQTLMFGGGLLLGSALSILVMRRISRGDHYLLLIANMIFSIGVIMIYRIKPALGARQLLIYLFCLAAYFFVYLFLRKTSSFWQGHIWFYFGITIALFLMTLVLGTVYHGAKNWVEIAGISIQPSEFAKIPFVFFMAAWYRDYERFQKNLPGKISLMLCVYLMIGLFFLQRELGTAVVFFIVLIASQVAFEPNKKIIVLNFILAVLGMVAAYFLFSHVRVRFSIWKDPWADFNNKGYQIIQSLFAIAEGGFFGTGIGLGKPEHIPLGYSDFIFSSIVEEMGGFMGICVILLFVLLLYRGIKIAMRQENDFYSVLAVAISVLFSAQALIMFGGVMKIIPLTGITVPFLTYGGSSLLSTFILLAVLQVSSEDLTIRRQNL
ncbi:MAG: FtsW/RodA/SpoVE family cell cycle protein [Peptoniphilaceae bacterium]|nr:FtsW/RodA/SpoVE family cell cycle protein [Peptoniphilaceae bacterium]MDD7433805.1 FtsW/RodA/SpoVE family cell cycle protein [Peptoniphilaceae bacterium]MDY3075967.1 FtsW/RodA/SpoVE family cell cycle protein [Peptoniphilaceae bacterium]MDY3987185.1 FtsW/RodA/SpoVE family cell cycle protein [Peptoniphilaceae bacterium]MDY4196164.1 FtsW/RodA/SpoVE family cell cycle protein [Peptoniphilaceae bacterium]